MKIDITDDMFCSLCEQVRILARCFSELKYRSPQNLYDMQLQVDNACEALQKAARRTRVEHDKKFNQRKKEKEGEL